MKIALLGSGKTGSKVKDLAPDEVEVFNREHPPTLEKLASKDVIISFLPGDAFASLIPLFLESKKPLITGSTGFSWPNDIETTLQEKKLTWIHATNFSLGIVILKKLIERLNQVDFLLENKNYSLHEIHHTNKLDSPSGTALSMKSWLNSPCEVTSERTADVVGVHTLTLETPGERVRLEHEARDRSLFAQGALWAASYLLTHEMKPGLFSFQDVVEKHLSL